MPPTGERVVGVHNWSTYPHLRWGFLHTREIVPTARIERGPGPVLALEQDLRDIDHVTFTWDGRETTVAEMIDRTFTDGFLVLHHGRVVAERYGPGMTPTTTHLLQSVSKSIAGTVAGVLVGRGRLDPDAPVTRYVEELAGTSFDGATVRHVLDMRTGTGYDETYDDPQADVFITEVLAGWRPGPRRRCGRERLPADRRPRQRASARRALRLPVDPHRAPGLDPRAGRGRALPRAPQRGAVVADRRRAGCRDHDPPRRDPARRRHLRDPARPGPVRAAAAA